MSPEIVESSFRFLLGCPELLADNFAIAWHGGEPLSLPKSFYDQAFTRLKEISDVPVQQRFTTNATLIDQDWCDLIRRWDVKIRVSIDGPQWLHDSNRVDRSGRGTFERAMRGIELLAKNQIRFDSLSVLSERTLGHAEELWRFFRGIGANSIAFCIEELLDVHQHNSLEHESCVPRLEAFFDTLLSLRDSEAPGYYIRELDNLIGTIPKSRGRPARFLEAVPLGVVSITWDGNVSTFSPELLEAKHQRYGNFILGNVTTHSMLDLLETEKFQAMYREILAGVQKCGSACRYFRLCGGGFPSAKLFQYGTFDAGETLSCKLRVKALANVALRHLYGQPPPLKEPCAGKASLAVIN